MGKPMRRDDPRLTPGYWGYSSRREMRLAMKRLRRQLTLEGKRLPSGPVRRGVGVPDRVARVIHAKPTQPGSYGSLFTPKGFFSTIVLNLFGSAIGGGVLPGALEYVGLGHERLGSIALMSAGGGGILTSFLAEGELAPGILLGFGSTALSRGIQFWNKIPSITPGPSRWYNWSPLGSWGVI